MIDAHHGWNRSYKPLFLGFISSIILILASYRIVTVYHLSDTLLHTTILGIATLQAMTQLFFYLHLGLETKPRWSMMTFLFAFLVIVIVMGGSLWIMYNLNYNLMPMTMPPAP